MSKSTLSIIEDVVTYRDRISEHADRDMLANVANELSRLNAIRADLLTALKACRTSIAGYNLRDGSVAPQLVDEFFNELQRIHQLACAAIAKATPPSASIGGS